MQLIYYRDGNGKILRHHLPPKGWTQEQLEAEVAKFNEHGESKAYIHEIEEGSLEMHLYEKAQLRKKFPKENVMQALDALEEAQDAIRCLEWEDSNGRDG